MAIKTGPKCPNHGCPLDGIPKPMPLKGEGICPVSGAHFAYEVDGDKTELKRDSSGNMFEVKTFNVTGND